MRAVFEQGSVTFIREADDKRYHGLRGAKGEHNLFHNIAKWLNARGFRLIKKRAQKDGHMVGDEYQPYIRCASACRPPKDVPHIYIISGFYALRGANEDWNKDGRVELNLHTDVFDKGQQTYAMIAALCKQYPDMEVKGEAFNDNPPGPGGAFMDKLMEDFQPA